MSQAHQILPCLPAGRDFAQNDYPTLKFSKVQLVNFGVLRGRVALYCIGSKIMSLNRWPQQQNASISRQRVKESGESI